MKSTLCENCEERLKQVYQGFSPKSKLLYKDSYNTLLTKKTYTARNTDIIGCEFILFLEKKGIVRR